MDSLFVDLIHLCQRYIYLFQILIFNAYLSNWFSYLYSEINYMRLYNLTYFIYILELRQILSQYTHCSYLNCHFFPQENDAASIQGKGRKRAAPRGRGRGSAQSSKRGRKSDNTTIQRMLMSKDDDDDDDDAVKRLNKSQPRVGFTFSFW